MAKKKKKKKEAPQPEEVKSKSFIQIINADDVPKARVAFSLSVFVMLIVSITTAITFVVSRYYGMTTDLASHGDQIETISRDIEAIEAARYGNPPDCDSIRQELAKLTQPD